MKTKMKENDKESNFYGKRAIGSPIVELSTLLNFASITHSIGKIVFIIIKNQKNN